MFNHFLVTSICFAVVEQLGRENRTLSKHPVFKLNHIKIKGEMAEKYKTRGQTQKGNVQKLSVGL